MEVGDVADDSDAFADVDVGLIDGDGITATLVCVTYIDGFDSGYFLASPKMTVCSG